MIPEIPAPEILSEQEIAAIGRMIAKRHAVSWEEVGRLVTDLTAARAEVRGLRADIERRDALLRESRNALAGGLHPDQWAAQQDPMVEAIAHIDSLLSGESGETPQ